MVLWHCLVYMTAAYMEQTVDLNCKQSNFKFNFSCCSNSSLHTVSVRNVKYSYHVLIETDDNKSW